MLIALFFFFFFKKRKVKIFINHESLLKQLIEQVQEYPHTKYMAQFLASLDEKANGKGCLPLF